MNLNEMIDALIAVRDAKPELGKAEVLRDDSMDGRIPTTKIKTDEVEVCVIIF